MSFFSKQIDKRIAAYQRELIETHYREVENGFVVYFLLLSGLSGFLMAVVVLTTVAGFFVSKRIHEWEYRHKDEKEQYRKELSYVSTGPNPSRWQKTSEFLA